MQNFTKNLKLCLSLVGLVAFTMQVSIAQIVNPRSATVSVSTANGTIEANGILARFGSARDSYCGGEVTGDAFLTVNDGSDVPTGGCSAIQDDLTGRVAFLDAGACQYSLQCLNAQNAGAIAAIVCAEPDDIAVLMGNGDNGDDVSIPAYMISWEDCVAIRALGEGAVSITAGPPAQFDSRDNIVWGANGEGSFTGDLGEWEAVNYTSCAADADGFKLWQWTAEGTAYTGAYAGTLAAINSPTACSGVALFNSDFYDNAGTPGNFGNGDCAAAQQGALISPAIDLSATADLPGLTLSFYQGMRQFRSEFYVAWSADGGMTWDSTAVNTELSVNSTLISERNRVKLPKTLLGQSDVRIKFSMTGNYYFWLVDDVQIVETESHNLAVDPFFAISPNAITPASQIEPFGFLADVRNTGALDQENSVLNVDIFNTSGEEIYNDSFDYGTIEADSLIENQLFENLYTPAAEFGLYAARYVLSSDNEDFDNSDNIRTFTFGISDTTFAKALQSTRSVAPADDNSYAYGNCYYVPNGSGYFARFVSFGVANPEDLTGLDASVLLFKWDGDANEDFEATPDEYGAALGFNSYVFQGDEEGLITIPISVDELGIPLEDDSYYFIVIQFTAPDDDTNMFLLASEERDYNGMQFASTLHDGPQQYATMLDVGNEGNFGAVGFGWGLVPIVQMHIGTSEDLTVSATEVLPIENKIAVFPNPASDELTVQFDLEEQLQFVNLRVMDATGRIISQRPLQNIQRNNFSFDVSQLTSGVYYLEIITEAGRRTERFVVAK